MLRRFAHAAFVILLLAAISGSVLAQDMRDRMLVALSDYASIQAPVEITSIELNGKELRAGEKIKGNDDWLRGVSFTVKNISDKPIAYVGIGLRFPIQDGIVVFGGLNYGVNYAHGLSRTASSPPALEPGESVDLVLTNRRYESFLHVLAQGKPTSLDVATYYIMSVSFENEPDVIWQGGFLKKRDPHQFSQFNIVERYVLPNKPE